MVALDGLPVDILHHIAQSCGKPELLSLRLSCRAISCFLLPYVDKHLAVEVCLGTHVHLHRAVAASNADSYYVSTMVPRLLSAKVPVDRRNRDGETALHVASRHGNLGGVCSLLNAGADVDAISPHGWTPLRLACRYGHVAIARLLLEFGALMDKAGFYWWTALHYAVQNGHGACIKVLFEYGATEGAVSQVHRHPAAEGIKQQWGIYACHVKP